MIHNCNVFYTMEGNHVGGSGWHYTVVICLYLYHKLFRISDYRNLCVVAIIHSDCVSGKTKKSNWAATLRSSQIGWSMFWRDSHPLTRLHTQSSGIKHIERVFTQFTTVNYLLAWFKENPSGHFILVWSVSENCFRWISSKQEWVFDNIVILAIDQLMLSIYAFG